MLGSPWVPAMGLLGLGFWVCKILKVNPIQSLNELIFDELFFLNCLLSCFLRGFEEKKASRNAIWNGIENLCVFLNACLN